MCKTILVTGFSGFIGKNFILYANEYVIREADLLIQTVNEVDYNDVDLVLHLAALAHQTKKLPEQEYYKINRDLAFEVATRAKQSGVKQFILMSTVKIYGEPVDENLAFNEYSPCNPQDPYGKSKFEAEKLILALGDESFKVAIIRSPVVYGVDVKANMLNLIRLVDLFPILPFKGVQNKRSMVYVGNLIAIIKQIINRQATGIFIAGDPKSLSTTELILLISKCMGKKRILIKMELLLKILRNIKPSLFSRLYGSLLFDTSQTNAKLDFLPPFTNEEGISDMVKWYKSIYK